MVSLGSRLCLQTSSGLRCYNYHFNRSLNSDRRNYFDQTPKLLIRHCSSKPSIIGSIFGRKKRKQEAEDKAKEAEDELRHAQENYEKELERVTRLFHSEMNCHKPKVGVEQGSAVAVRAQENFKLLVQISLQT